jgi:hypothetical protein
MLLGACLGALAAAAPAEAGTARLVTYQDSGNHCRYGGCFPTHTVRFAGGPGEHNRVTVARDAAGDFVVRDAGAALSVRGCTRMDANTARCHGEAELIVSGADGDDSLALDGVTGRLNGGAGDDLLTGSAKADVLSGGPGDDEVHGGAGQDRLLDGVRAVPRGGAGDDSFDGGDGFDLVDYAGRLEPVTVRLDDLGAPSGGAGERDRLSGIEAAAGGLASDRIVGDDALNDLYGGGGPGADVIEGRGGDDRLGGGARLDGGAGDDVFSSSYTTLFPAGDFVFFGLVRVACGAGDDAVPGPHPFGVIAPDCEAVGSVAGQFRNHLPLQALDDPVVSVERGPYARGDRLELRASGIAAFRRHPRAGTVLGSLRTTAGGDLRLSERGRTLLRRYGAIRVRVLAPHGRAPENSYLIDLRLPPEEGSPAG